MPRAAFFQTSTAFWGRSFEDGIIRALLSAGYDADIFAPNGDQTQELYPPRVSRRSVDYNRRWMTSEIGRRRWREYDLFLGNPDLGIACAGALAAAARRPLVCACDEIYSGGYHSPASGLWLRAAHWAMRRADLTVIPTPERIPLQRVHAGLSPRHPFSVYPCCFSEAYRGGGRDEMRRQLGISVSDLVLAFAAELTESNGADWAFDLLDQTDEGFRLLLSPAGRSNAVERAILHELAKTGKVIFFPDRVSFLESAERLVAADAALIVYRSSKPQFQCVGTSSQRLCAALWVGVPVIALTQPSFAFVEKLDCGVLIREPGELREALERVRSRREAMVEGTRRALTEHVRAEERLAQLTVAFHAILSR